MDPLSRMMQALSCLPPIPPFMMGFLEEFVDFCTQTYDSISPDKISGDPILKKLHHDCRMLRDSPPTAKALIQSQLFIAYQIMNDQSSARANTHDAQNNRALFQVITCAMKHLKDNPKPDDELAMLGTEAHHKYISNIIGQKDTKNIYLSEWQREIEAIHYPGDWTCLHYFHFLTKNQNPLVANLVNREAAVEKYSWAIPNEASLDLIKKYSPIVEIGSGSGYWAWLLRMRGIDIVAVDDNSSIPKKLWIKNTVIADGESYLTRNNGCSNRTLLLCWPRNVDNFVDAYSGKRVIWIGRPGCSPEVSDKKWNLIEKIKIPTWPCNSDESASVYERITK